MSQASRAVEQRYRKVSLLEHVLLRPDSYVGSTASDNSTRWVLEEGRLRFRQARLCPALYKIYDEVLVNASDNFYRGPDKMSEVHIDLKYNNIHVRNNGLAVPIVWHDEHEMWLPSFIFGELLTSDNYNDDSGKKVGGRNGYGAKLANIFSSIFTIEVKNVDEITKRERLFFQTWRCNMTHTTGPLVICSEKGVLSIPSKLKVTQVCVSRKNGKVKINDHITKKSSLSRKSIFKEDGSDIESEASVISDSTISQKFNNKNSQVSFNDETDEFDFSSRISSPTNRISTTEKENASSGCFSEINKVSLNNFNKDVITDSSPVHTFEDQITAGKVNEIVTESNTKITMDNRQSVYNDKSKNSKKYLSESSKENLNESYIEKKNIFDDINSSVKSNEDNISSNSNKIETGIKINKPNQKKKPIKKVNSIDLKSDISSDFKDYLRNSEAEENVQSHIKETKTNTEHVLINKPTNKKKSKTTKENTNGEYRENLNEKLSIVSEKSIDISEPNELLPNEPTKRSRTRDNKGKRKYHDSLNESDSKNTSSDMSDNFNTDNSNEKQYFAGDESIFNRKSNIYLKKNGYQFSKYRDYNYNKVNEYNIGKFCDSESSSTATINNPEDKTYYVIREDMHNKFPDIYPLPSCLSISEMLKKNYDMSSDEQLTSFEMDLMVSLTSSTDVKNIFTLFVREGIRNTEAYTSVRFFPDFNSFGLPYGFSEDTLAIFRKRALDICATTRLPISLYPILGNSFNTPSGKEWLKRYISEKHNSIKKVFFNKSGREEIILRDTAPEINGKSIGILGYENNNQCQLTVILNKTPIKGVTTFAEYVSLYIDTAPDLLYLPPLDTDSQTNNTIIENDQHSEENLSFAYDFAEENATEVQRPLDCITGVLGSIFFKMSAEWDVGLLFVDSNGLSADVKQQYYRQMSFVNSVCTTHGGSHVNVILDNVAKYAAEASTIELRKRGLKHEISPVQLKPYIWIFVNALVEMPRFDSQTKDTLRTATEVLDILPSLPPEVLKAIDESGIIDRVCTLHEAKLEQGNRLGLEGQYTGRRILNIPKLMDANWAGRVGKSQDATLILTEGDSAKALAVAGMSIVGRDQYGVFPLRGKLMNVRNESLARIALNSEITDVSKILGLVPGTVYDDSNLHRLRYGHVLVMTDQDLDGSHIKGLLLNLFAHMYPSLLKKPGFLQAFITPVLKAFPKPGVRGGIKEFYDISVAEAWGKTPEAEGYTTKYYKGLGTSTSKEAREYFSAITRNVMKYVFTEDHVFDLFDRVFNSVRSSDRKDLMSSYQQGSTIDFTKDELTFEEFVNLELVQYQIYDSARSIPNMLDGLKTTQRKVLCGSLHGSCTDEKKVAQLVARVSEKMAYHHGEASLATTIIGMAQNFVGSNNINLLRPIGQFGTRLIGGKDAASTRYICTAPSFLAKALFPVADEAALEFKYDDSDKIEPVYYVPVIPLVLCNGALGVGTGWSTFIPNFNPSDLVQWCRTYIKESLCTKEKMRRLKNESDFEDETNDRVLEATKDMQLKRILAGNDPDDEAAEYKEIEPEYRPADSLLEKSPIEFTLEELNEKLNYPTLHPWYRNFKGSIVPEIDSFGDIKRYICYGCISKVSDSSVRITELPIGVWTSPYREFLSKLSQTNSSVEGFRDFSSEQSVEFVVVVKPYLLRSLEKKGSRAIFHFFHLQSRIPISNMVCFNKNNIISRYPSAMDIMKEFAEVRKDLYQKRKEFECKSLQLNYIRLLARIRFIQLVVNETITIEGQSSYSLAIQLLHHNIPTENDIIEKANSQGILVLPDHPAEAIAASLDSTELASQAYVDELVSKLIAKYKDKIDFKNIKAVESNETNMADNQDSNLEVDPILFKPSVVAGTEDTLEKKTTMKLVVREYDYLLSARLVDLTSEAVAKLKIEVARTYVRLLSIMSQRVEDIWTTELANIKNILDSPDPDLEIDAEATNNNAQLSGILVATETRVKRICKALLWPKLKCKRGTGLEQPLSILDVQPSDTLVTIKSNGLAIGCSIMDFNIKKPREKPDKFIFEGKEESVDETQLTPIKISTLGTPPQLINIAISASTIGLDAQIRDVNLYVVTASGFLHCTKLTKLDRLFQGTKTCVRVCPVAPGDYIVAAGTIELDQYLIVVSEDGFYTAVQAWAMVCSRSKRVLIPASGLAVATAVVVPDPAQFNDDSSSDDTWSETDTSLNEDSNLNDLCTDDSKELGSFASDIFNCINSKTKNAYSEYSRIYGSSKENGANILRDTSTNQSNTTYLGKNTKSNSIDQSFVYKRDSYDKDSSKINLSMKIRSNRKSKNFSDIVKNQYRSEKTSRVRKTSSNLINITYNKSTKKDPEYSEYELLRWDPSNVHLYSDIEVSSVEDSRSDIESDYSLSSFKKTNSLTNYSNSSNYNETKSTIKNINYHSSNLTSNNSMISKMNKENIFFASTNNANSESESEQESDNKDEESNQGKKTISNEKFLVILTNKGRAKRVLLSTLHLNMKMIRGRRIITVRDDYVVKILYYDPKIENTAKLTRNNTNYEPPKIHKAPKPTGMRRYIFSRLGEVEKSLRPEFPDLSVMERLAKARAILQDEWNALPNEEQAIYLEEETVTQDDDQISEKPKKETVISMHQRARQFRDAKNEEKKKEASMRKVTSYMEFRKIIQKNFSNSDHGMSAVDIFKEVYAMWSNPEIAVEEKALAAERAEAHNFRAKYLQMAANFGSDIPESVTPEGVYWEEQLTLSSEQALLGYNYLSDEEQQEYILKASNKSKHLNQIRRANAAEMSIREKSKPRSLCSAFYSEKREQLYILRKAKDSDNPELIKSVRDSITQNYEQYWTVKPEFRELEYIKILKSIIENKCNSTGSTEIEAPNDTIEENSPEQVLVDVLDISLAKREENGVRELEASTEEHPWCVPLHPEILQILEDINSKNSINIARALAVLWKVLPFEFQQPYQELVEVAEAPNKWLILLMNSGSLVYKNVDEIAVLPQKNIGRRLLNTEKDGGIKSACIAYET